LVVHVHGKLLCTGYVPIVRLKKHTHSFSHTPLANKISSSNW
jgi:hypothetical protein